MAELKDIEIDQFYSFIDSNPDCVVYFWGPHCGLCRYTSPIFENVVKEYDGVSFAKLNVTENTGTYSMLGIKGVPTIKFYKDGMTVNTIVGCKDMTKVKDEYKQAISDLING